MQTWCLSNGAYSLKSCHNPFGKGFQPPRPYGKIPVEHLKSLHGASLNSPRSFLFSHFLFCPFLFRPQFLITSVLNLLNHLQLTSSKFSHFQVAFLPPHFKCLNISPFLCHHCCDGTSFLVLQPLKSQSIQLCVHKMKCPQIRQ